MIKKIIWLYGLSGAGKTTLGKGLSEYITTSFGKTIILDADIMRKGINRNLGFCKADRIENIRRIAEVAKLFYNQDFIPIVCAITPYEQARKNILEIIGEENLILIYIKCSIEKCEERDIKGLYAKAREGKLKNFTGIGDIFEEPALPELLIETDSDSKNQSLEKIISIVNSNCKI